MTKSHKTQIEAFLIDKDFSGWYVLDWDFEGYERTVAGPYKSRRQAVNKAIDLSYPC